MGFIFIIWIGNLVLVTTEHFFTGEISRGEFTRKIFSGSTDHLPRDSGSIWCDALYCNFLLLCFDLEKHKEWVDLRGPHPARVGSRASLFANSQAPPRSSLHVGWAPQGAILKLELPERERELDRSWIPKACKPTNREDRQSRFIDQWRHGRSAYWDYWLKQRCFEANCSRACVQGRYQQNFRLTAS